MIFILVILIELILLYYFSNKLKKIPRIRVILFLSLLINSFFLLAYRIDLASLGREVYFSDAEMYWNATKNMLNGAKINSWNVGYVYYSFVILKFSITQSPILINISNMLITYLSILMLASLMLKYNINEKNIKVFLVFNLFNTLIFYSLFRNVKDGLFLFYSVLSLIIISQFFKEKKILKKIVGIILLGVVTILLYDIRPWGFLIPMSTFMYGIITVKRISLKKVVLITITTIVLVLILFNTRMKDTLIMWVPIVLENGLERNVLKVLLGPLNLIIGPGPIRSLFGSSYFLYTTRTGNIACFLGSSLWWIVLPYLIALVRPKRINRNIFFDSLGIILMLFILIYTLQYGGSAEIRFRGVLYVLLSCLILSGFKLTNNRNVLLKYSLFGVVISIGGIIFGV